MITITSSHQQLLLAIIHIDPNRSCFYCAEL